MAKRTLIGALLLAVALTLTACSGNGQDASQNSSGDATSVTETSTETTSNTTAPSNGSQSSTKTAKQASGNKVSGVTISFDFSKSSTPASNQIACWVENDQGAIVRTIYVSDFVGSRRGYEFREDALKHWVDAADLDQISDQRMDAISAATLQEGKQTLTWDLKDDSGKTVAAGTYRIRLEGTLYWGSNVVYTGTVNTRKSSSQQIEVSEERSQPNETQNESMLANVKMKATQE